MAAFVGLLGVLLGAFLGKGLERLLDLHRRRDRQIDMVFALHAEISAGQSAADDQNSEAEAAYLLENELPAGPSDRTDFVFDALKADLSILPQPVIHQIVLYYRLAEQSNMLTDFLGSQAYSGQSPEERRRYRRNLLIALADQKVAAGEALNALETFIAESGATVPQRSRVASNQRTNGADHDKSPDPA
ncbi:hypothetical protein [Jiella sp. M17.18]|uniref:hypothetical protein n=1 Tax=Jiella sp. M17.18 TaxID=3234247 RepID=UPI0034DEB4BA